MSINICKYLLMAFTALCFVACQKPASEPSFYYWRTTANLSQAEKDALTEHQIKTMYLRFFDIDIPDNFPEPLGVIDSVKSFTDKTDVIPVVFITNRTFLNAADTLGNWLPQAVLNKINTIYSRYKELQIDCDWSEKTKDLYFNFLTSLKSKLPKGVKLSCTIRLHQVKYPIRSGVPPVDRGMLMFYNMGNIANSKETNSIFNAGLAGKYTSYLKNYALPLDIALPVFRWYVHYRNNDVLGLIAKKQLPDVKDSTYFYSEKNSTNFKVKSDHSEKGIFYKKDDVLRFEALNDQELLQAAHLLHENLNEEKRRIAFYDLDEININYYDKQTFKTVFSIFN